MKKLFSNKLFLTGFIFIAGLFLTSVLYYCFKGDVIPHSGLLFERSGSAIKPPYNSKDYPPFGTDNFGRNILFVMIVGAKYTIGAAVLITILRVLPSTLLGFLMHFNLYKFKKPIEAVIESVNYFPITLLAFLLLKWICFDGIISKQISYSFWESVFIFIIVLAVIAIPSLSVLISNEVRLIMDQEFISCSMTLGATRWHLILKHVKPFLVPQLFIISLRELIQTMILISHLGVLGIFMGGVTFKQDLFQHNTMVPISNEWAGELGNWWDFIWTSYPWITFIPVIFFTCTILSAKCMLEGLKQVADMRKDVDLPSKQDEKNTPKLKEPFCFLHQKNTENQLDG
ncbi:ABC transporter permease [Falsibacillus albus]|uniref:ABC transporter permease subunit n=1 Tax=Falsibacillus albus TaxID=2478915 RepID=A0A3L7JR57_9BACI|nr:ABC transporter permease subunit [Falsibacillus albus]RLQ93317.1 ABC transporter permease subunit [Falsibacillus albus]